MHLRLRVRAAVPVAVLFLVSLFVAGCGSSGSSTSTEATATITKAQFVAKGNAVCVAGDKAQEAKIVALFKAHGLQENEEPTKAQLVEATEAVYVPSVQGQIDGLTALGAPSGEEQAVSSALKGAQEAVNAVKANPELAFAKESPFHSVAQELHALGLTHCAPNG